MTAPVGLWHKFSKVRAVEALAYRPNNVCLSHQQRCHDRRKHADRRPGDPQEPAPPSRSWEQPALWPCWRFTPRIAARGISAGSRFCLVALSSAFMAVDGAMLSQKIYCEWIICGLALVLAWRCIRLLSKFGEAKTIFEIVT